MSEEFLHFLEDFKERLDPPTTCHLMASHGRIKELLVYAELIGDHDRLIQYHLQVRPSDLDVA